ncbi:hypothetical protein QYM36_010708 [Artemia franciscana]|uniref:Reverse transcriptase domain-containing protein n=1 Tax=Artemia franciscana TaxID=6661 RepID=A0AA88L271_ARTSF|nr:hypothetical protein QYM36_010708 [Artemia franciscana]
MVLGLGIHVSDLEYADDIDALAADPVTAQAMLNEITHFSQLLGMKINTAKTIVMDLNIQSDCQLVLYGQELERVNSFTYLGSVKEPHGGCDLDKMFTLWVFTSTNGSGYLALASMPSKMIFLSLGGQNNVVPLYFAKLRDTASVKFEKLKQDYGEHSLSRAQSEAAANKELLTEESTFEDLRDQDFEMKIELCECEEIKKIVSSIKSNSAGMLQ